jgi:hypothetical protein
VTEVGVAYPVVGLTLGEVGRRLAADGPNAGAPRSAIMITGDYPGTAMAIAREIGLDDAAGSIIAH